MKVKIRNLLMGFYKKTLNEYYTLELQKAESVNSLGIHYTNTMECNLIEVRLAWLRLKGAVIWSLTKPFF